MKRKALSRFIAAVIMGLLAIYGGKHQNEKVRSLSKEAYLAEQEKKYLKGETGDRKILRVGVFVVFMFGFYELVVFGVERGLRVPARKSDSEK